MTDSAYHLSLGDISRFVSSNGKVHLPISSHIAVTAAALLSCASSARTCTSDLPGGGLCIHIGSLTRSTFSTISSRCRAFISRPLASAFSGSISTTLAKTEAASL